MRFPLLCYQKGYRMGAIPELPLFLMLSGKRVPVHEQTVSPEVVFCAILRGARLPLKLLSMFVRYLLLRCLTFRCFGCEWFGIIRFVSGDIFSALSRGYWCPWSLSYNELGMRLWRRLYQFQWYVLVLG